MGSGVRPDQNNFEGGRLILFQAITLDGQRIGTIALESLAGGRVGISACALGVATAAYEELFKAVHADPQPYHKATLARAYVRLSSARSLVERAADAKDRGDPFVAEASAAKICASEAAVWIAGRAVDVLGADAVRAGARAQRLLRDARVFPIVEGTTEIQELILARALLGS